MSSQSGSFEYVICFHASMYQSVKNIELPGNFEFILD